MCGILGGTRMEWNYEAALAAIQHRGPDGQRIQRLENVILGFARLAIIDLSENGMQPMLAADGRVAIVFNGEIYGYQDLKRKLEKKGYIFKSTTDSEVLLNAYLEFGDKFVQYIDGMFAIAIYDSREQKIKLFRDRVGIKPLYYYYDGESFAFCSELKGLCVLCEKQKFQIDETAIYDYLTYTYIPEPKTMYRMIYKLPPACMIVFDEKQGKIIKRARYWSLKVNENQAGKRTPMEIQEDIRYLIKKSVREQMIADVPVGSFLSGGMDSSVITYEAFKINPQIQSFSIGFSDKQYDESSFALFMAETYGINKNIRFLDEEIFEKLYLELKDWYDEPYADTSAFPTYFLSELARENVSVVLTGDGGDEIFGGYSRYERFAERDRQFKVTTRKLSRIYEKYLKNESMKTEFLDTIFLEEVAKCCKVYNYMTIFEKRSIAETIKGGINKGYDDYWYFRKYYKEDLPPVTRLQYMDFHTYLPSDILTKIDRTSMQHSLEARVPFLSKELVEYMFSLAEEERCPRDRNGGIRLKALLKDCYMDILPETIINRKKKGFSIPKYYLGRSQLADKKVQECILQDIWKISYRQLSNRGKVQG